MDFIVGGAFVFPKDCLGKNLWCLVNVGAETACVDSGIFPEHAVGVSLHIRVVTVEGREGAVVRIFACRRGLILEL